jgi:hypothetical protein
MIGKQAVIDIIAQHGDLFAAKEKDGPDEKAILKTAGYFEADALPLFLKELAEAEPVEEAVRKQGSNGRKKRYYEAAEAFRKAGGLDLENIIGLAGEEAVNAVLEKHGGGLFVPASESIEEIALAQGFNSGTEMLEAMAKAPPALDAAEAATQAQMRAKARQARKWATEQVENPGDAGLHHPDEDIGAENIEITRRAIYLAMKQEERRRHEYANRKAITDQAVASLSKMPLRKAANYSLWAAAERKHALKAAEAAATGDRETALDELEKQQKFHAMVTEAFRIRRDRQKFINRYASRAARSDLATVEYKFRETIRDILTHWLIVRSKNFRPDNSRPEGLTLPIETDGLIADADLDGFLPSLETLISPWIKEKRRPEGYLGLNDLNAIQMRELDQALGLLMNRGRGELKALRQEGLARFGEQKLKGKIEAAADDFGRVLSLFLPVYTPIRREIEMLEEE